MRYLICSILVFYSLLAYGQNDSGIHLALLKYQGGGDWYANPTALGNLTQFANRQLGTDLAVEPVTVEVGSSEIFNYPWIHMTGHGNVVFSEEEAQNLRLYLMSGGFLHIDDNYGMDPYVRVAMKQVFPELSWVELPYNHPIYNQKYTFTSGVPKIHEHDNKPAQGLGLIWEGRVVCFYSYESDLGDGWEDASVHNDPETVRRKALQMVANLIQYAFNL